MTTLEIIGLVLLGIAAVLCVVGRWAAGRELRRLEGLRDRTTLQIMEACIRNRVHNDKHDGRL